MKNLISLSLMLLLAACGSQKESGLEWPELNALDHEVEELDGLLAGEPDPAAMTEHLPHVREAVDRVLAGGVPNGADNRDLVEQKLEELRSLASALDTDPDARRALHPLVSSIMEEAGMPHVHDEDDNHGHGHDDGEHGHDH